MDARESSRRRQLRSARAPRVLLVPVLELVSPEVEPEPMVDDEEPDVPEFIDDPLEPVVPEPIEDDEPALPEPVEDEPVEPLVLGLAEPLVPDVVELPEPMLPLVVLFVVEPEPPPALPLLLPVALLPLVPAPPPAVPLLPLVPCATAMPIPRAIATAAAIVNMRGCLLMMSVLLQVQEKDRGCDRFAR